MNFLGSEKMKRLVTLLAAAAMSSTLAVKTAVAEEVLTAVHAFPPFLVYTNGILPIARWAYGMCLLACAYMPASYR